MKILIIRLSALGDVAMTLPVVYSVARANTDVKFDVLTRPFFARLFINRPSNVGIVIADYKGEHKGLKGIIRLLNRLRKSHYDAVADLHNVGRSWIIDAVLRLCGCKIEMVNKMRSGRKDVLKSHTGQSNFIDRYIDVFHRLGLNVTLSFHSIFDGMDIKTPLVVEKDTIGIAPFARYRNKALPLHQLKSLVAALTSRGHNVMLFGGRGHEAETLGAVAREYERCECVAGRFAIAEELALMSKLKLMVSMDSANQHLSSIVGTRVMTLWGSTTPLCGFAPYGQSKDMTVTRGLDCQPCTIAGSDKCPLNTFACLSEMDMDEVVRKIESPLQPPPVGET